MWREVWRETVFSEYDEWDRRHPDNAKGIVFPADNPSGVWMTVARAAKYLGVNVGRVSQLISEGRIRAVKMGKWYLIGMPELLQFRRFPRGKANFTAREKLEAAVRVAGGQSSGAPWFLGENEILVKEAAVRLMSSAPQVRKWLKEGRLTGNTHTWGMTVHVEAIKAFVRKRKQSPRNKKRFQPVFLRED